MTFLKWLLVVVAGGYVALVAAMYFAQRSLQYFPDRTRRPPATLGLQAEEVVVPTQDGEQIVIWHAPPRGDAPVVLYFQGNGGGLDLRVHRFRDLVAHGAGVIAVNYRGFGGSSGSPSEAGILRDAEATYGFAAAHYPANRIVLWGESLGTGVAVAVAAEHPVARVLLESPYTSITDVGASLYWFVPVRALLKDSFHSDERIGKVTAPVMVLHGVRDKVVPIAFGERLFGMIGSPKRFLRLPEAGHNDHDRYGALDKVRPFLLEGLDASAAAGAGG